MKRFTYHVLYALYLYKHVPGLSFREAWKYPFIVTNDPIDDAEAEIQYMKEDSI